MSSLMTSQLRLWASGMLIAALAVSPAAADGVSASRQAQLKNLIVQDCGSCHGLTMKGGLGSPLQPVDLADIDEASIAQIVLDGVPGTPMPPWRGLLTQSDADWIAHALKNGVLK